jgi:hypothetical protein
MRWNPRHAAAGGRMPLPPELPRAGYIHQKSNSKQRYFLSIAIFYDGAK